MVSGMANGWNGINNVLTEFVGDTSNIAKDVNTAPLVDDLLNSRFSVFLRRHIAFDVESVRIGSGSGRFSYVKTGDLGTFGCEKGDRRSSNAIVGTGDNDNLRVCVSDMTMVVASERWYC